MYMTYMYKVYKGEYIFMYKVQYMTNLNLNPIPIPSIFYFCLLKQQRTFHRLLVCKTKRSLMVSKIKKIILHFDEKKLVNLCTRLAQLATYPPNQI